MTAELYWLPKPDDFQGKLGAIKQSGADEPSRLDALRRLANHNLSLSETAALARALEGAARGPGDAPAKAGFRGLRVAVLASSTVEHLLPGIRVAALRRGLLLDFYVGSYGQYRQELLNPASGFYAFKPDLVWLAVDADEALMAPSFSPEARDLEALAAEREAEW
ncbi:MAG: methoxymalonyl-ACP biosynthesis protein FkbH, partial [Elusimicrobia bacterium]|nr:methoxymalonyl-ACP biosynthesis protein FkbH [Elusimicrobiota bacterium]